MDVLLLLLVGFGSWINDGPDTKSDSHFLDLCLGFPLGLLLRGPRIGYVPTGAGGGATPQPFR